MKKASKSSLPQKKNLNARISADLFQRTKGNKTRYRRKMQDIVSRGLELANQELEATIAPQPQRTAKEATNS